MPRPGARSQRDVCLSHRWSVDAEAFREGMHCRERQKRPPFFVYVALLATVVGSQICDAGYAKLNEQV